MCGSCDTTEGVKPELDPCPKFITIKFRGPSWLHQNFPQDCKLQKEPFRDANRM